MFALIKSNEAFSTHLLFVILQIQPRSVWTSSAGLLWGASVTDALFCDIQSEMRGNLAFATLSPTFFAWFDLGQSDPKLTRLGLNALGDDGFNLTREPVSCLLMSPKNVVLVSVV